MNTYFNVRFEFDKTAVLQRIDDAQRGYICVVDGNVLNSANRNPDYLDIVNGSLFSICDSSWVPVFLKHIYGVEYMQYCGADIFHDIVSSQNYRMIFIGTQKKTLDGLKNELIKMNPAVDGMQFVELPFCNVEEFNYPQIARMIEEDGAKIIWVALGAPKQEYFMNLLLPHLESGVMIGVGAVFKFFSGTDEKRCPRWMQKYHLEFLYRIFQDPKKQLKRCFWFISSLPKMYIKERKLSKHNYL